MNFTNQNQKRNRKLISVSAGIYGSKKWVLTEKYEKRIPAAEMRFLRSTLGVTSQDRLTNEAIRKALKVNSFNDTVSKYRDSWLNHITQMHYSHFLQYKHIRKEKCRPPKEEMDKSHLRSRN
jgi:hypothetical protein